MNKNIFTLFFLVTLSVLGTDTKTTTVTLFSHGIAGTWKQVLDYIASYKTDDEVFYNERYLFHTPFVAFNYPDATDRFYRVNYAETSFGQENEIMRLHKAYHSILSSYKNSNIILWGLSRGASNVLIFAGLHELTNIKAIVLESPYYTMSEVIESLMIKKNMAWLPVSYGETFAEFIFKKYSRHGWSPAKCIENIPKDIPILVICTKEDHLVPYTSSINVYKKLIESGHQHTYLFVAETGRHAAILKGPDGEKYQWVVNAFYEKYNLPHCAESAAKGKDLLALCQPTL
jgi:predicted esterase